MVTGKLWKMISATIAIQHVVILKGFKINAKRFNLKKDFIMDLTTENFEGTVSQNICISSKTPRKLETKCHFKKLSY